MINNMESIDQLKQDDFNSEKLQEDDLEQ